MDLLWYFLENVCQCKGPKQEKNIEFAGLYIHRFLIMLLCKYIYFCLFLD